MSCGRPYFFSASQRPRTQFFVEGGKKEVWQQHHILSLAYQPPPLSLSPTSLHPPALPKTATNNGKPPPSYVHLPCTANTHARTQPPKTLPPQAKLNLILAYFHTTGTAHSIKDLEKALPGAAGISPMVVKDFLAALSDEGLIRVEKIGSGNWYWSFKSDEKKQKGRVLEGLEKDLVRLGRAIADVKAALVEEGVEEEELEVRRVMAARIEALMRMKRGMEEELKVCDPGAMDRKRLEIGEMKAKVNMYTGMSWSGHRWLSSC